MNKTILHSAVFLLAVLVFSEHPAISQETDTSAVIGEIRPQFRPLARMFSTSEAQFPTSGNTVQIIKDGLEKLDLLAVDMMEAEDYIHMEYFEFFRDPGSRLVRLAMNLRGEDSLEVRYIVEDFMDLTKSVNYFGSMRRHGVEVGHYSLLHLNRRNHQKIVVIDGKIGYTGGMNIGNHYFYSWKDTHLRLTGPCVESLENHYSDMWKRVGGKPSRYEAGKGSEGYREGESGNNPKTVQIVSSNPADGHEIMDGYVWILDNCLNYIYIQTPYFTPPREIRDAMRRAVARGVEVYVLIPEKTDMHIVDPANRSYYRECLDAGVRIFQSKGKFDHSKMFVCDDYLSSVGSANLDGRSMKINHEINTYIYNEETALQVKERILEQIRSCSEEITAETLQSWSAGKKIGNSLARILAGQL